MVQTNGTDTWIANKYKYRVFQYFPLFFPLALLRRWGRKVWEFDCDCLIILCFPITDSSNEPHGPGDHAKKNPWWQRRLLYSVAIFSSIVACFINAALGQKVLRFHLIACTRSLGWLFSLGWNGISWFSWYYMPNQAWLQQSRWKYIA